MEKFLTSWHIRRDTTIKLKDGILVLQKIILYFKIIFETKRKYIIKDWLLLEEKSQAIIWNHKCLFDSDSI